MIYDEPEKMALREYLIAEKEIDLDDPFYLDDIEQLNYDFYGAPLFEVNGNEYAVIDGDLIESVFHDYAEQLIDEVVLCDLPERYRGYFDYEKFIRDMSFDGYGQMSSYDGNDYEIKLDDTYYHILRVN